MQIKIYGHKKGPSYNHKDIDYTGTCQEKLELSKAAM